METENYIIVIAQIALVLLGGYMVHYSKQKGKNQADREDLQKLTEIVEDVKNKYATENEFLKSSLSVFANKQNTLFSEAKDSIIEYYSNLNKWIWHSLNISANDYNHTNFSELSNKILVMQDQYNDTNISFGKIQLLSTEDNLIQAGHEAIMQTLYLHQFIEGILKRLQSTLSSDKFLIDQLFSTEINFDILSKEIKDYYQKNATDNEIEKKKILQEFSDKRMEFFSKAMDKRNEFRDLAKAYLAK